MNIRVATEANVETLFDIRTSVRQNRQSREEVAAIGVTPESIAAMLRTTSRAWIAEEGRDAVAFAMADAGERTVFAMFVKPDHEGGGLGRALMQEAESWLFASGCDESGCSPAAIPTCAPSASTFTPDGPRREWSRTGRRDT